MKSKRTRKHKKKRSMRRKKFRMVGGNNINPNVQTEQWKIPVIQKVKIQIPQNDIQQINMKIMKPCNPSIIVINDRYLISFRYTNTETTDGKIIHRSVGCVTDVILGEFNSKFNILYDKFAPFKLFFPEEYIFRKELQCSGLEDGRLFGTNSIMGNSMTYSEHGTNNKMARVDYDYNTKSVTNLKKLDAPIASENKESQKNWLPFIRNGDEMYIYKINPFIVCKLSNNEIVVNLTFTSTFINKDIRGSASPILWSSSNISNEAFLMVVHYTVWEKPKPGKNYYHQFMTLTKDLIPSRISNPFVLADEQIHFVAGLCESLNKGAYVLTMGVNDREAWAVEIDKSTVEESLINKI